ncbi:hypothetical protein M0812_05431 [Anaeramoeba flamelloides]|uniref:DUF304 domain-containing protein n=1 Tax=Anaeramoeba flamelloides TaxID=1746091 RepID=A0AAV8A796_9EUKA|nr:hypothetical protein M0812_05431 [Anaeramoeba flamelloides]
MALFVFVFWFDLIFAFLVYLYFYQKLQHQSKVSNQFKHCKKDFPSLSSLLPKEMVNLIRTSIPKTEKIVWQTIPTSANRYIRNVSYFLVIGNIGSVTLGILALLFSQEKDQTPLAMIFIETVLIVSISFFSIKTMSRKLQTLYVLTESNIYLLGNYEMKIAFQIPNKVYKIGLDQLYHVSVKKRKRGTGDISFSQNNQNLAFKQIHYVEKVELKIRKQIEKFQLTNTGSVRKQNQTSLTQTITSSHKKNLKND